MGWIPLPPSPPPPPPPVGQHTSGAPDRHSTRLRHNTTLFETLFNPNFIAHLEQRVWTLEPRSDAGSLGFLLESLYCWEVGGGAGVILHPV